MRLILIALFITGCGADCTYYEGSLCVVEDKQHPTNRELVALALNVTEAEVNLNKPGFNMDEVLDGVTLKFGKGWKAHTLDFDTMEVGAGDVCSWTYQSVAHEALHIIAKKYYGLSLKQNKAHWPGGPMFDSSDQADPGRFDTIEYHEEVQMVTACQERGLQE